MMIMEKLFDTRILMPDRKVFEGRLSSLIAPGELGYFGILANHAPFITTLRPGKIMMRDEAGKAQYLYSSGNGYLKVSGNEVTILLDSLESKAA